MNEIKLVKQDIDINSIINSIFKKENWGKSYLMYKLGDVKADLILSEFNFERNVVWFKINLSYNYNGSIKTDFFVERYFLKNDDILSLMKRIRQGTIELIEEVIKKDIKQEAEDVYRDEYIYLHEMNNIIEEDLSNLYTQELITLKTLVFKDEYVNVFKRCLQDEYNEEYNELVELYIKDNYHQNKYLYQLKEQLEDE